MAQMRREAAADTPALEWLAASIGLALIFLVGIVIGREAATAEAAQPPSIEVRMLRVTQVPTGFVVAFEAVNHSQATAAAVSIEGKAGDETSTATLDYVAGHGSTEGGLFFTQDPRKGPLELRALGFQTP